MAIVVGVGGSTNPWRFDGRVQPKEDVAAPDLLRSIGYKL